MSFKKIFAGWLLAITLTNLMALAMNLSGLGPYVHLPATVVPTIAALAIIGFQIIGKMD